MSKKILILQGHPDKQSFNHAIHASYKQGALKSGAQIEEIFVGELDFKLNLQYGYRQRVELEPCLIDAQKKIKWADHIVVIYPVWWGAAPAVLKGFFDRVLLPGFAFKKRENSVWWDKLLTGKTGHVISTMDQPAWYYFLIYWSPSIRSIKNLTLEFCGIKPVKVTSIGPIRLSKTEYRAKWLSKIEAMGYAQK